MNSRTELTDEQQAAMSSIESATGFRLRRGHHRLSEFVEWVFIWMPIIAPLPNLFSLMFAISNHMGGELHHYLLSFFICAAIELMLIGVSEQLNGVIDKWLRADDADKKLYYFPLVASSTGALFIVAIMLGLVYFYEVKGTENYTLMALPFISVLSVMFMGIRSYLRVVENVRSDADERTLNVERTLNAELNAELNELREHVERTAAELVQYTEELQKITVERNELKAELRVEHERSMMFEQQLNAVPERRPTRGNPQTKERRNDLFVILSDEYNGLPSSEINKSELASRFGTSHTTISRDLKALEKSGAISLNGVVKVNQ